MTWQIGTTGGANWQVGTTSQAFTFGISQAGDYRNGSSCVLQVVGADGSYSVKWAPTSSADDPDAVTLTILVQSLDGSGNGSITVQAARGVVRYGETGYLILTQADSPVKTSSLAKTLLIEATKQYINLVGEGSPPALAEGGSESPPVEPERITAIPDLEVGDQLIWWNVLPDGSVDVAADASFVADNQVKSFSVEAHIARDTEASPEEAAYYTAAATQTVNENEDILTAVGITAGAPIIGSADIALLDLLSANITTGAPTLGSPLLGPESSTADGITAGVPTLSTPTLGIYTPPAVIDIGPASRLIETANREAVAKTAVRAATFVFIDIPGDPVRVNTSALNIETGGFTWTGTGTLGGVELMSEDTQIIGAPVRLTLSGIPSALLTTIQTADYRNRTVEIYAGFFDQDWRLLTGLENMWSGVVDFASMSVGESTSTIILTCENTLAALVNRPIPIRYTDQEQRRRFPGDNFFSLLPAMFDLQIEWGGVRVSGGGGTSPSDDFDERIRFDPR